MRILRVIPTMNPRSGGPREGICQASQVLDEQGHSTEIVCVDDPSADWVPSSPWPIHALGPAVGSYCYSSRFSAWMKSRVRDFDCVVIHGLWQYPGFATWRVMRNETTPYFVYPHGMLDPWFQKAYPLKHVKKSIYWKLAESRVLKGARAVLFTSDEEKLQAGLSFRPAQYNGVTVKYGTEGPKGNAEDHFLAFREKFPHLDGKRFLLFLGRIHPKKGCDLLLEAFAKVAGSDPDLLLVIAGPDQIGLTEILAKKADELGISDRVQWPGMVSGNLKWGLLRAADAFVLPSHQENFGIAVAEALACGLPTLISNKVNIWREIEAAGAGIVEPDDLPGTVECLGKWLALSPSERQMMKTKAVECFNDSFHIRAAAESLISVLRGHGVGDPSTR